MGGQVKAGTFCLGLVSVSTSKQGTGKSLGAHKMPLSAVAYVFVDIVNSASLVVFFFF